MHPHLDEICDATREAGINAHVSTNFSFTLSDDRLRSLLSCGLSHLSVCVDGLTQESYSKTRVGGRIELVLDNLRRLLQLRREMRALARASRFSTSSFNTISRSSSRRVPCARV